MPAETAAAPQAAEQQPQGRSWKHTVFQILMFQMVMRFFFPKPQQQARDPVTGEVIPPLKNSFLPETTYDLLVYISPNASATLQDWAGQEPLWFLPSQQYSYDRKLADRRPSISPLTVTPDLTLYDKIITQHLEKRNLDEEAKQGQDTKLNNQTSVSPANVLALLTKSAEFQKRQLKMKDWTFMYLLTYAVPHTLYEDVNIPTTPAEVAEVLGHLDPEISVPHGASKLIEYMQPIRERELQSLLGDNSEETDSLNDKDGDTDSGDEVPHWKSHLDIRIVVDQTPLTPQTLQAPHLKRFVNVVPEKGVYHPILYASDLWLLERDFIPLNETLRGKPLNLTLTFNSLNAMWWLIQSQMNDAHSRRETFMIKRIILDTNPYLLAFSGAFMLLHTVFSMLAFKNDIQFWRRNESMEGLSALSILFSFVCEIVIALYLYDSEETSFLILFEIFLGLAISAWKVTKAISFSFSWKNGLLPQVEVTDKKDYEESKTKQYDRIAIKFMSILLLPCMLGYAGYSLKYKKHKSWYSFIISTLAGTVYTFGFIMMTPQLYINYKLKSVDHLPWRAFTYKALNTFVDDIAAFIIDMPWMHRLACFRDDIIFVCYLYQRWIYSVDKTRPSEWVDPAETERLKQQEKEEVVADSSADTTTLLDDDTSQRHDMKHDIRQRHASSPPETAPETSQDELEESKKTN